MKEIKIKDIDETVYEYVASSGLKVYIWPYNLSEEISLSLTVKYGSIDTDFKIGNKTYHLPNGIAHFLEHIKFNEKKGVTAHDYFNKIGSYTNAYTTYDHTSYEVTCTNNLKDNLNHLLYFVLNPYFTKDLVEKEKGIIASESNMVLDNPYSKGYQKIMENLYKYDKKRFLVTGTEKEVKDITLEDAKCVFDNFYHPENMFLTITGNVNPYEVIKIVDKYFTKNPYDKYTEPKRITKKEPDNVLKDKDELITNVTKEKLFMAFKIPRKGLKKIKDINIRILFNLLMTINFGTTSTFNDDLLNKGLIDDYFYNVLLDKNHVVILIESSTSYPKDIIKLTEKKMKNLSFTKEEFTRKIKSLVASSILGYEDPSEVNSDIRMDIIKYGKIINNLQSILKSLKTTDLDNIISNIKDYSETYIILKPME